MKDFDIASGDAAIYFGEPLKALGDGVVAGYLIRFGGEQEKDLTGEFFTKSSYLGPNDGNGADVVFHHSRPLLEDMDELADHLFEPLKTRRDDIGIWAETVLDLADDYERMVHELVERGKLGWSSGSAIHMVRKKDSGEITRWPIIEGSLTPVPAEPRNRITTMKALCGKRWAGNLPSPQEFEKLLREAGFSRSQAKAVFSKGLAHLTQREAGAETVQDILKAIRSLK